MDVARGQGIGVHASEGNNTDVNAAQMMAVDRLLLQCARKTIGSGKTSPRLGAGAFRIPSVGFIERNVAAGLSLLIAAPEGPGSGSAFRDAGSVSEPCSFDVLPIGVRGRVSSHSATPTSRKH
jgi:hypothetical protein